jgi:hypothetical protein
LLTKNKKIVIITIIAVALALNAVTFTLAYSETFTPKSPTMARDFSAYYVGEWRLFHNPTAIYDAGSLPGDAATNAAPQTFKYTPSFLIWFSPFLTLNYQNALNVFDIIQFASIFVLAFFVYKIVKDKNVVLGALAAVVVLLDPLPNLPLTQGEISFFGYRFSGLSAQTFSPHYYWGYALANAHVLQTVLIVGALYFGYTKKPWLSAFFFAFSIFDPRASFFALPLLIWYNRQKLWQFIGGSTAFIAITNLPFFFYSGIGTAFLTNEFKGDVVSQMHAYDWTPLYAIAALTILEAISVVQEKYRSRKPGVLKSLA